MSFLAMVKVWGQDTVSAGNSLTMVIAGDIMGHDTQIAGAFVDSSKTYDYEPTYRFIKDYFSAADIAIANLEVTLAGPPYKGYPQFSSPDELALEAKNAGIDVLLTANNHALDRGKKGVARTIEVLDSFNIVHTGTFLSPGQRDSVYPLSLEQNNIKVALLNYTYGTNGLKVDTPYVVNRIDTAIIRKDLDKARKLIPDFICVTIHWGIEYQREENLKQQKLAEFIFEHGADAIIGSHPHVVQPVKYMEVAVVDTVEKRPVFYSLGNFVSNQRARYKDGGIVAELHLSKEDSVTTLDSIAYMPYWVYRKDVDEKSTFYVLPIAKYESDSTLVDFNDNDLWRFNRFQKDTRAHIKGINESVFYQSPVQDSIAIETKNPL